MTVRGRLAMGSGVVAAAFGLAVAVDPSLAAGHSVDESVVIIIGALAIVYAGLPAYRRRATDRHQAPAPHPESRVTADPPGEDVDRLLAAAGRTDPHTADRRHRLRRRLLEAATAAVRRREDCDTETARQLLANGAWTDDPVVASYFTNGPIEVAGADLPLHRRIRMRVSLRARRAYAARRVADEVASLTEPGVSR